MGRSQEGVSHRGEGAVSVGVKYGEVSRAEGGGAAGVGDVPRRLRNLPQEGACRTELLAYSSGV